MKNWNLLKSRVSEIHVKRIRFNQGLGLHNDLWKGVDINYFFAENPISKLLSFSTGYPYESDLPLYISGIWSIKLCVNVRRSKRKEIWVWSRRHPTDIPLPIIISVSLRCDLEWKIYHAKRNTYSKALRCTFWGEIKNLCSSKFVQLELIDKAKERTSKKRAALGFH